MNELEKATPFCKVKNSICNGWNGPAFLQKKDIKVKISAFFELVGGQVVSGSRVEIIKKVMISKKFCNAGLKNFMP